MIVLMLWLAAAFVTPAKPQLAWVVSIVQLQSLPLHVEGMTVLVLTPRVSVHVATQFVPATNEQRARIALSWRLK